jgi:LysR family hydrogen peroxide-inducible transcriptional activator
MEFNQIRYFLNLADTLNFTEAAMRGGVSQPALTRAIQRLEQELGGALAYRDGKDSRLTALGHDIRSVFAAIAEREQRAQNLLRPLGREQPVLDVAGDQGVQLVHRDPRSLSRPAGL